MGAGNSNILIIYNIVFRSKSHLTLGSICFNALTYLKKNKKGPRDGGYILFVCFAKLFYIYYICMYVYITTGTDTVQLEEGRKC